MKLKIILVLSIIVYSVSIKAQTQSFAYTGINIGYGTGLPVYSMGSSAQTVYSGTTYTLEKGNYGQGLNFGISLGYMFTKNTGMELGVSYLIGSKKEFIISSIDTDTSSGTTTENDGTITLDKIKMIRVNPSFKVAFGDQVRPFLRMGLILGFGTSYTRIDESIVTTTGSINDTNSIEKSTEFSGGTAFGFNSAFGVDIDLTDNLTFTSELSFSSVSWAASRSEITRYIYNGVDQLPSANPASLKTNYVNEYTQSSPDSHTALKTYLPFGCFAINAGVVYRFGSE